MIDYMGIIETEKTYYHIIKDQDGFKTCEVSNLGIIDESEPCETLEDLYQKIQEEERKQRNETI